MTTIPLVVRMALAEDWPAAFRIVCEVSVEKAAAGSIRGDLGLETQYNLVHGSDSPDSAEREIALWFPNL